MAVSVGQCLAAAIEKVGAGRIEGEAYLIVHPVSDIAVGYQCPLAVTVL